MNELLERALKEVARYVMVGEVDRWPLQNADWIVPHSSASRGQTVAQLASGTDGYLTTLLPHLAEVHLDMADDTVVTHYSMLATYASLPPMRPRVAVAIAPYAPLALTHWAANSQVVGVVTYVLALASAVPVADGRLVVEVPSIARTGFMDCVSGVVDAVRTHVILKQNKKTAGSDEAPAGATPTALVTRGTRKAAPASEGLWEAWAEDGPTCHDRLLVDRSLLSLTALTFLHNCGRLLGYECTVPGTVVVSLVVQSTDLVSSYLHGMGMCALFHTLDVGPGGMGQPRMNMVLVATDAALQALATKSPWGIMDTQCARWAVRVMLRLVRHHHAGACSFPHRLLQQAVSRVAAVFREPLVLLVLTKEATGVGKDIMALCLLVLDAAGARLCVHRYRREIAMLLALFGSQEVMVPAGYEPTPGRLLAPWDVDLDLSALQQSLTAPTAEAVTKYSHFVRRLLTKVALVTVATTCVDLGDPAGHHMTPDECMVMCIESMMCSEPVGFREEEPLEPLEPVAHPVEPCSCSCHCLDALNPCSFLDGGAPATCA